MSDDVDEDPTGNKAIWDRGLLSGASQKVRIRTKIDRIGPRTESCVVNSWPRLLLPEVPAEFQVFITFFRLSCCVLITLGRRSIPSTRQP